MLIHNDFYVKIISLFIYIEILLLKIDQTTLKSTNYILK